MRRLDARFRAVLSESFLLIDRCSLVHRLTELAERQGRSEADLLREAIEDLVAKYDPKH